MNNKELCVQLLNKGVQCKRNGDYNGALQYYGQAYAEDPLNKFVYYNSAKICAAVQQSDAAMKHLLCYSETIMHDNDPNYNGFEDFLDFYEWNGALNRNIVVHPNIAFNAIAQNSELAKIVADINLTFNAGFCFITKHRNILTNVKIPANYLNNYINALLGKPTDEYSLINSSAASMVRAIGLSYLLVNFITSPNVDITDKISHYLSDDFVLDSF